jgi:hypothetical protein
MMTTDLPIQFHVQEASRTFRIDWLIPGISDLADFLYWALKFNARYEIREPASQTRAARDAWLELRWHAGCSGEYKNGLYWGHSATLFRVLSNSTHTLTHHGLDGLPTTFLHSLSEDVPLFIVTTRQGAFTLTLADWWAHLASGQDERELIKLGIQIRVG